MLFFLRVAFREHQTMNDFFAQNIAERDGSCYGADARMLSRAFIDFCRGRALGRVCRFYAIRRRKSRFSKNLRHTANITSRYVNPTFVRFAITKCKPATVLETASPIKY